MDILQLIGRFSKEERSELIELVAALSTQDYYTLTQFNKRIIKNYEKMIFSMSHREYFNFLINIAKLEKIGSNNILEMNMNKLNQDAYKKAKLN